MTESKMKSPDSDKHNSEKPSPAKATSPHASAQGILDQASHHQSVDAQSESAAPFAKASSSKELNPNGDTPLAKQQIATKKEGSQGMGKGLSWFAMLLSAAALVAAGFTWYQTQIVALQNETKLSVGVSEIGTQVSRLGDAMTRLQQDQASVVSEAELNNQLLKIQHNVEAGLATLQDRQSELDQSVTRIITDMQTGANKFVLDEVSHLLRIANNSVLFGGNAIGAANAMSAAEDLLKSLSNPMYAPLRIAINQEVTQLQAVQQPDFTALSVGLRAVRKSVPLLPLANEPDELQAVNSSLAKEPVESWQAAVSEMWSDLTQLVQVKRVDQPPKPLLAPEQRYFLNQNLQLQLSAAELALMQQNEEAYNGSIEDAVHWLKQYFDLSDKKVQAALKQLASNEAQQFETELPDISGSYQILQSLQDGQ